MVPLAQQCPSSCLSSVASVWRETHPGRTAKLVFSGDAASALPETNVRQPSSLPVRNFAAHSCEQLLDCELAVRAAKRPKQAGACRDSQLAGTWSLSINKLIYHYNHGNGVAMSFLICQCVRTDPVRHMNI